MTIKSFCLCPLLKMVVIDADPETHKMVQETIGDKLNIITHSSLEQRLETLSMISSAILVTDLLIHNKDISQTINTLRQQNPPLIQRQQVAGQQQEKRGWSDKLMVYLQKIQRRQTSEPGSVHI